MFAIGATEMLALVLVSGGLVFFAARNRVPALVLVLLVLVLSPLVASSLALVLGTVVDVVASAESGLQTYQSSAIGFFVLPFADYVCDGVKPRC